jgi:hypothetical protein
MSPTVVSTTRETDQMSERDMCARFRMVEQRCGQLDIDSSPAWRGMRNVSENSDDVPMEPISPELALVDPELGARARATLGDPIPPLRFERTAPTPPSPSRREHRPYPFWARVTAALWLLVLGILIGGAAIPHAQDLPRIVPQGEDARFCPAPTQAPTAPPTPRGRP